VRQATPEQLRKFIRSYDWRLYPETVLSWALAQRPVDLGSALTCFFNGEPERFNYLPKRDVPEKYYATAQILDNICLRVNSGFYLCLPDWPVEQTRRLGNWLTYQQADRSEKCRGRWILDENILSVLTEERLKVAPDAPAAARTEKRSLLRDVLSPVAELGVSREYLKYLPAED
jgi:hypothetical protein